MREQVYTLAYPIVIIAISLLIFSFFILISIRNKKISEKCLIYWDIYTILFLTILFIAFIGEYNRFLHHLTLALSIAHGPFIYLYTNMRIRRIVRFDPKLLLHFVPTVIFVLLAITIKVYSISVPIDIIFSILSLSTYTTLSIIQLKKYQKKILNIYSDVERRNYTSLKYLLIGILIILSLSLVSSIAFYTMEYTLPFTPSLVITILLISSNQSYQSIIDRINYPDANQTIDDELYTNKANYITSKLTIEDQQALANLIKQYIQDDKPYLKIDLRLSDVAKALDQYPHHITEVLNTVFNRNFNDFINFYRVEEAKRQLLDLDKKNITFIAIANDCGFNSKSSFYRTFKQNTGMTPTEYIKVAP